MEKSGLSKIIHLVIALIFGALIGNMLMIGILMACGLERSEFQDIFSYLGDPNFELPIKAGIALTHLFTFTFSSFLYWKLISREQFRKFFQLDTSYDFSAQVLLVSLLICSYPMIAASADMFRFIDLPSWMETNDSDQLESLAKILNMDSLSDFFINLFVVALLPAIGEELLFRGIIQKELLKKIVNPHIAIFLASFIFAAVHLQVTGLPPKLIIGLILGYAMYWTGSIKYSMVLHFINNSLPLLALYLSGGIADMSADEMDSPIAPIYIGALISSIVVYFLLLYIRKNINLDEPKV